MVSERVSRGLLSGSWRIMTGPPQTRTKTTTTTTTTTTGLILFVILALAGPHDNGATTTMERKGGISPAKAAVPGGYCRLAMGERRSRGEGWLRGGGLPLILRQSMRGGGVVGNVFDKGERESNVDKILREGGGMVDKAIKMGLMSRDESRKQPMSQLDRSGDHTYHNPHKLTRHQTMLPQSNIRDRISHLVLTRPDDPENSLTCTQRQAIHQVPQGAQGEAQGAGQGGQGACRAPQVRPGVHYFGKRL